MTTKNRYREFEQKYKEIPIFLKPWWMDAVAEDDWDVFLYEENEQILASFVYYKTKRENKDVIAKATLTQCSGPFLVYPKNQKYHKKLSYEEKIFSYFIEQIEQLPINYFDQNFHYEYTNWLPFYWKGYTQTTRYTYVIKDTKDLEKIRENYHLSTRYSLKQASKIITLVEAKEFGKDSLKMLYETNKKTFDRQEKKIPYSYEFLNRFDDILGEHQARRYYFAVDKLGRIHAIAYFVWDNRSVYYLIGGADPMFRNSQAQSLLVDKGIELAHEQKKWFDFEGSMLSHVEPAFRKFGGVQMPYFRIFKTLNERV